MKLQSLRPLNENASPVTKSATELLDIKAIEGRIEGVRNVHKPPDRFLNNLQQFSELTSVWFFNIFIFIF